MWKSQWKVQCINWQAALTWQVFLFSEQGDFTLCQLDNWTVACGALCYVWAYVGHPRTMGLKTVFKSKRWETSALQLCLVFFLAPSKRWRGATNLYFGIWILRRPTVVINLQEAFFQRTQTCFKNTAECPFSLVLSALVIGVIIGASLRVVMALSGGHGGSELQNTFLKKGSVWTFLLGFGGINICSTIPVFTYYCFLCLNVSLICINKTWLLQLSCSSHWHGCALVASLLRLTSCLSCSSLKIHA